MIGCLPWVQELRSRMLHEAWSCLTSNAPVPERAAETYCEMIHATMAESQQRLGAETVLILNGWPCEQEVKSEAT